MSRADYVAQKIREAADHPKAPFLFAIGAERPKPQSAASEAYALGLTVQEEKLAKWVAVLKRDAEKLFGKPFLEALRGILKEGESEMKVRRGAGFFFAKSQPLFRKFVEDLLRSGLVFSKREGVLCVLGEECSFRFVKHRDSRLSITTVDGEGQKMWFYSDAVKTHSDYMDPLCKDEGFPDLFLKVADSKALNPVKRFARAWEAKSKQLKGSREATVTIFQDFA